MAPWTIRARLNSMIAPALRGFDRHAACAALAEAVADESDVVAAYLFGSVARGTAGPQSDVDVALLLAPGVAGDAVCGRVEDRLARRLHTDRIDVVSVIDTPIPVRYRIFRDGARVVCRQPALCQRVVADAVSRYLDFQPVRERAFEQLRNSILRVR